MEVFIEIGSESWVELGVNPSTLFRPGIDGTNNYGGSHFPPYDFVPRYLHSCMYMKYIPTAQSIGRRTSFSNQASMVTVQDANFKPRHLTYHSGRDFAQYGDVISNALRVARGWSRTDFANENGVQHASVQGSAAVITGDVTRRFSRGPAYALPTFTAGSVPGIKIDPLDLFSSTRVFSSAIKLNNSGTIISPSFVRLATHQVAPLSLSEYVIPALVRQLNDGTFDVTMKFGSYWYTFAYSNAAQITSSGRPVGLRYDIRTEARPTIPYPVGNEYYIKEFSMEYEYFLDGVNPSLPFANGTYNLAALSRGVIMRVEERLNSRREGGVWVNTPIQEAAEHIYTAGANLHVSVTPSQELPLESTSYVVNTRYSAERIPVGVSNFMDFSILPGLGRVGSFESFCDRILIDIRTSSSISGGEALSSAFDVLTTNHIETIAELRDIGALLKPLEVFRRWWQVCRGKRKPSLIDIVNDYTNLRLAFDFAIKPTVASALEIVDKALLLKQRLEDGYPSRVSGQGIFTYRGDDLDEALGGHYPNAELITRSKVVVAMDASSALMTMLGARALGILPSLENFWDLVPFSFMVDWFTNLDDRIGEIDTQVFAKCVDISYCTHSYSIRSELSEDELSPFGLTAGGMLSLPSVCYYRREKSRWFPALRDSRFDWLAQKTVPDFRTVGSVIYQLAKN